MRATWHRRRQALPASARYDQKVLAAALFGIFATNINVSVLAVVVPQLVDEFDTNKSIISWVVVGPMLAFAVVGPIAGKLGDLYGRRRVYLVGLAGTALFSALSAGSSNVAMLIAFRTIATTMGSSCAPAGMAIISQQFPRHLRVKALGYWGLVLAGGPVLGMIVGGPVAEAFGWRWLFIPQIPLALVAMAVAAYVLPETPPRAGIRFDVAGSALLGATVGSLLLAVNRGPSWGWGSPEVVGLLVAGPLLAAAFVRREGSISYPLIPLEYFRRRNFAVPLVAQFFVNFAYQGGFVLTPLMLGEVYGYRSGDISLITVPRPLFYAVAGPVAGALAARLGERNLAMTGGLLVAFSSLMLSLVDRGWVDGIVFAALATSGAGLGLLVPAVTATVTTAVDDADLGIAGAATQTTNQIGTVIGMQALQTVQLAREAAGDLTASYESAFAVGAGVAVVGVLAASAMRRRVARAVPAVPG